MPPDPPDDAARRLAEMLLARARHDIMAPLSVALGHAQLLRRRLDALEGVGGPDCERLLRSAAAIEDAGRELAAVLDRLVPADCEQDASSGPQE
jgi:signal transduction histidine kinase